MNYVHVNKQRVRQRGRGRNSAEEQFNLNSRMGSKVETILGQVVQMG